MGAEPVQGTLTRNTIHVPSNSFSSDSELQNVVILVGNVCHVNCIITSNDIFDVCSGP